MGVPGMISLLKRHHEWSTSARLRDSKLIVDVTDEMYWFVKKKLLAGHDKMDRFGTSMVSYGQLLRQLFERLRLAKITPIIVYNGARLSETTYGPMVSKTKHLEKSAHIRMHVMARRGVRHLDHQVFPSVACNVAKQIINELQLEAHQSTYEVYPLLVRLANENDCPVLTSHSDFILANVKRGFLLFEDLDLSQPRHPQLEGEISCSRLYKHQLLSSSRPQCSSALYCLNVLMRPDFSGRYYEVLNRMFELPAWMKFQRDNTEFIRNYLPKRQPCCKRLEHILLAGWPSELTDPESVRRTFEKLAAQVFHNRGPELEQAMRDYDALWMSFSDANDHENMASLMPDHSDQIVGLQDALTKRESTAPFLTDILMKQTNIDRLRIEDLATFRSTYSLADPVKLLLMNRGPSRRRVESQSLRVFDRQHSSLQHRMLQLNASAQLANDLEAPDQMLYDVFLFPGQIGSPSHLRAFIRDSRQTAGQVMKFSLALKEDDKQQTSMCEQLIVLLRLVVFSFMLGLRENYDLPSALSRASSKSPPPTPSVSIGQQATKSLGGLQAAGSKSQSGSLTDRLKPNESKYRKILPVYLNAVYMSVVYYCFKRGLLKDRMEEHELLRNDADGGFYSKVCEAVKDIDSNKISHPVGVTHPNYLEIKHMNEMLNSSLHAYMELNSFYNHPGAVLKLSDYYDCVLIFKICSYLLQATKPNLLTIEKTDRLYTLISDCLD